MYENIQPRAQVALCSSGVPAGARWTLVDQCDRGGDGVGGAPEAGGRWAVRGRAGGSRFPVAVRRTDSGAGGGALAARVGPRAGGVDDLAGRSVRGVRRQWAARAAAVSRGAPASGGGG